MVGDEPCRRHAVAQRFYLLSHTAPSEGFGGVGGVDRGGCAECRVQMQMQRAEGRSGIFESRYVHGGLGGPGVRRPRGQASDWQSQPCGNAERGSDTCIGARLPTSIYLCLPTLYICSPSNSTSTSTSTSDTNNAHASLLSLPLAPPDKCHRSLKSGTRVPGGWRAPSQSVCVADWERVAASASDVQTPIPST